MQEPDVCEECAYENSDKEYTPALLEVRSRIEWAIIEFVIEYERARGCQVNDVHDKNIGYDLISRCGSAEKRIEVKGLSDNNASYIIMTFNEHKASRCFKDGYYLYVVEGLPRNPRLIVKRHHSKLRC